jgi:RHS repeat-associated protein
VVGSLTRADAHYVHPDHLGSTNVVTDEADNLVQTLDYYPFGATRISVSASTNEQRKYIDQFRDVQTGLDYLNARYYDSSRGQFVTQDPVFWEIAQTRDGRSAIFNPQSLNSYAYANDNPIVNKDPEGRIVVPLLIAIARAALIGFAINTDISTAQNISDNILVNGQTRFDEKPGVLLRSAGEGAVLGVGGEAEGGAKIVMSPGAKSAARLVQQSVGAGATQVAIDVANGNTDREKTAF